MRIKNVLSASIAALLLAGANQASALSGSFSQQVTATVPTICRVAHHGSITTEGSAFGLGQLTEYCNAPTGFSVYVEYAPGTLVGTKLTIGNRVVVLDGSGRAEVSNYEGPKVVTVNIGAEPGIAGFDTSFLTFGADAKSAIIQ